MPWFRITYTNAGRSVTGYREYQVKNIEEAWQYFLQKARQVHPELNSFDCVMVSVNSPDFISWYHARESRRKNRFNSGKSGTGKYRGGRGEGPDLGERQR